MERQTRKEQSSLPLFSALWKMFVVNSDRRGVGNWGLQVLISQMGRIDDDMTDGYTPLVNGEILGQVGSKADGR